MKEYDLIKELHKAENGPYDDQACSHCTKIIRTFRPDASADCYVEYPCDTIKILDGE